MKKEIENRLMDLSVGVSHLLTEIYIADQTYADAITERFLQASLDASLNYSEVQWSDSEDDRLFFNTRVLKGLRSTQIILELVDCANVLRDNQLGEQLLKDCEGLLTIFQDTVTTQRNERSNTLK